MTHILLILGGLTVVIGVLALLWGATVLAGRLLAVSPAPAVPAAPPSGTPAVPPHHLAAIAAAVAAMTGGRGRVLRVSALPHRVDGWTHHARAGHAAGHRVRWDWAVPGPPHIDHAPSARKGPP